MGLVGVYKKRNRTSLDSTALKGRQRTSKVFYHSSETNCRHTVAAGCPFHPGASFALFS